MRERADRLAVAPRERLVTTMERSGGTPAEAKRLTPAQQHPAGATDLNGATDFDAPAWPLLLQAAMASASVSAISATARLHARTVWTLQGHRRCLFSPALEAPGTLPQKRRSPACHRPKKPVAGLQCFEPAQQRLTRTPRRTTAQGNELGRLSLSPPPNVAFALNEPHDKTHSGGFTRTRHAASRFVTLGIALLITLLTGCGSGGSVFGGANVPGGGVYTQPNAPVTTVANLKVHLDLPLVPAKTASAASSFGDTATVTVNVLDRTTHQPVVPAVTQARPNGAQAFDVLVPNVPVGGTQHFTATYSDSSAQDVTYVATWSATEMYGKNASSLTVATINASTGLATGIASGFAAITATASGVTSTPALPTVSGGAPTPTPTPSLTPGLGLWSAATDLSATGQNANSPQIALSADGTKATAVWQDANSSLVQAASCF